MIEVKLYTRQGCQLCEEARNLLEALQSEYPHHLQEIDIDETAELQRKFSLEIPVIEIGPYTLKAPINLMELRMTLGAAQDRERHIEMLDNSMYDENSPTANRWTRSDKVSLWIGRHYMLFFNLLVLIYVGLPFLAPVLKRAGADLPALAIYRAYGFMCHQLGFRSFFLFGEQPFYPRAAANIEGYLTFSEATGLSEGSNGDELFQAARYEGDELVGYKVALCERDVAIYLGFLLFGIIFALSGHRIPALHWAVWLGLAIVPIGLDGFSQIFSQPPLNFIPYRESTPFFRVLTGGLFGVMTAWFGYPMVEESMAETRQVLEAKLRRVRRFQAGQSVAPAMDESGG